MTRGARVLLEADWRWLVMLNYQVDESLLVEHVPEGTELDCWHGRPYVSLVGFLFRDTRVFGVPVPWHGQFEEMNLRFYVRRVERGEVRRAVTFIRELVPRPMIASAAHLLYNEPYQTALMRHRIAPFDALTGGPEEVEYGWRVGGQWGRLAVRPQGHPRAISPQSEDEYIAERHWGYTRQRDGGTAEYEVRHSRWRLWRVGEPVLEGELGPLYGQRFAAVLGERPSSAFLADGSPVTVSTPRRLPRERPGDARPILPR